MKVYTKWPGLIPAIKKAGHEPVLVEVDLSYPPDAQPTGDAARISLYPGEEKLIEEYERDCREECGE